MTSVYWSSIFTEKHGGDWQVDSNQKNKWSQGKDGWGRYGKKPISYRISPIVDENNVQVAVRK